MDDFLLMQDSLPGVSVGLLPLSLLAVGLIGMLCVSAFFSASETAMMAINRYQLKNDARLGHRGARLTLALLRRTDRLLGMILLGNTFANTGAATLAAFLAAHWAVHYPWAPALSALLAGIALLLVGEALPKVLAAAYPQQIAYVLCYPLSILQRLLQPAVWFVNLFTSACIALFRLRTPAQGTALSREELRTMVLEAGQLIATQHGKILLNLFELEQITVDDVMVPRQDIEAIDLDAPAETLRRQLATCHHTRLLAYRGQIDQVAGIIHVRRVLRIDALDGQSLDIATLREVLLEPYYILEGTPLFQQLQAFQQNRRRLGLVVDEYGELLGLLTLEDILEQVVGEFTSTSPGHRAPMQREETGNLLVSGRVSLRELNHKLGTHFPLDGPRTLNGLLLEYCETIPEPGTCLELHGVRMEVLRIQHRSVRSVRFYR